MLCRNPGAHIQTAADDEARQVSLRHHLRHRAGAAGPDQVRVGREGAGVSTQDRHLLTQAERLRVLRPLLRLLGPQQSGQGDI